MSSTGAVGYLQASCGASAPLASGLMGDIDSGGSDDLFAISRQMGFLGSPGGSSSATTTTAVQQQYYACQLPTGELGTFNLVGYVLDCSLQLFGSSISYMKQFHSPLNILQFKNSSS
jgi:hypothetical protein